MIFRSPDFILTDAVFSDVDALVEIHGRAFHRGWSAAEIEALMVRGTVIAIVGRARGLFGRRPTAGFVMIGVSADESEVLTLAVDGKWQGQGLGRRLMDEAMRRLYGDRVKEIFLEVDEGNAAARRLYKRLGFREVGRRNNYYASAGGAASTALVMRALLT